MLRLFRLYTVFHLSRDSFQLGPLRLHFGKQWHGQWLMLAVMCTPHWILYGLVLPSVRAIRQKNFAGGNVQCLYHKPFWAIVDMGVFFVMVRHNMSSVYHTHVHMHLYVFPESD